MKRYLGLIVAAVMSASSGISVAAQTPPIQHQPSPDSPIGVRNPEAPAELKQLEFLIGDWKVALVLHQPNGDMAYEARWHNIWVANGTAIMQEWRDPYVTGIELRSYNPKKKRWEGRNFYSSAWTSSEGSLVNGEFIIDTVIEGPDGTPALGRERYFDIRPGSFRMMATRSTDGGKTWSAPTYEMTCTRIG